MTADLNKMVFSKNLKYYLAINGKNQNDIVRDLGITASTVSDWVNGKKYPRVDKMQLLADYFGIMKSDLMEDRMGMMNPNQQKGFHFTEHEKQVIIAYRSHPNEQATIDKILDLNSVTERQA